MATLLEVLKDKVSRRQIFISVITYLTLAMIVFTIGFIAAHVYNSLFPQSSKDIQSQIEKVFNLNITEQKQPPTLNI